MHIALFLTLCPFLSLLLTLQSFLRDLPRTGTPDCWHSPYLTSFTELRLNVPG